MNGKKILAIAVGVTALFLGSQAIAATGTMDRDSAATGGQSGATSSFSDQDRASGNMGTGAMDQDRSGTDMGTMDRKGSMSGQSGMDRSGTMGTNPGRTGGSTTGSAGGTGAGGAGR